MATVTKNYSAKATLTWGMTNPSSDTNLLIGRQSTAVNNNAAGTNYMDIMIGGRFQGPAASAAAGVIEVWAYGSWDAGTTFTSDCTGTDGALTLVAETKALLHLVTVVPTNTTNGEDYYWGPFSLAQVFGGVVPEQWGLWGTHDAGAALQTSTTEYQGIKFDSA